MTDGLKVVHREAIIAKIAVNDRVERAVLFGSRATGTNTVSSDVDIALFGSGLTLTDQARLVAALDEIPMAQSVDLLLYDSLQDRTLREHIRRQGVEWYSRSRDAWSAASGPHGPEEWPTVRLGDAADLFTGFPFKSDGYVSDSAAPRLLRGDNIVQGRLRWDGVKRWPAETAAPMAKFRLHEGDVVLAMDRPWIEAGLKFASIHREDLPALLVQRVARLRGGEGLDTRFLKYVIGCRDFSDYVLSVQTGTAVPHISARQIEDYEFDLPPLDEQTAIASILGRLDDKIQLNRRMNATLEAMARALFRSWFVDFDPVRAKMEGRDTGLPTDIADLFPDRLVASEIGWSPEGWPVTPLTSLMEVNPKRSLQRGEIAPYLDMANMPTQGHVPDSIVDRSFGSGMRFVNGDTLIARITPCLENGKTAYVDFLRDHEVGWGSTEFIVLKPQSPLPDQFAYCLARSTGFREFAVQSMSGTSGRQRVPASALSEFLMAAPPASLGAEFGNVAGFLFERASRAARESRALSALRDALLPKLVSGKVRVNAFEAVCGPTDVRASVGAHEA